MTEFERGVRAAAEAVEAIFGNRALTAYGMQRAAIQAINALLPPVAPADFLAENAKNASAGISEPGEWSSGETEPRGCPIPGACACPGAPAGDREAVAVDRDPGFYWVRFAGNWEPAEWTGEHWYGTGVAGGLPDTHWSKIGGRIGDDVQPAEERAVIEAAMAWFQSRRHADAPTLFEACAALIQQSQKAQS